MNTSVRDFIKIDMRGLQAALVTRARAQRVSVSALVRGTVARELGVDLDAEGSADIGSPSGQRMAAWTKLSVRMTAAESARLAAGARAAGLSRGAYLAGLVDGVPVLRFGGRSDCVAALRTSSAELATLSRNIHRLTALLRQANAESARPYRDMLDTLTGDVRRHLEKAAAVLANLQPQARRDEASRRKGEHHGPRVEHRRRPDHVG